MDMLKKRTWAEVSLGAIAHNAAEMRAHLPAGCRFLGVVKADAYGHGAIRVSRLLSETGCDYLAVATADEAAELRAAGITLPILILGPSPAFLARELAEMGVTQAVGDIGLARALSSELGGSGKRLAVHLKLDTGMSRTGFRFDGGGAEEALKLAGLDVQGVFTHFAVSDVPEGGGFTATQFARFTAAAAQLESAAGRPLIKHCANSGATVSHRECCLDMVRPGVALYGAYSAKPEGGLDLRPAMSLRTRVYAVTEHFPGDTVSYGRTFTAERATKLTVLPIGYADGLHRSLSNKTEFLINGRRAPQVGRICMDMCMADATDIPGVKPGDIATVFGGDGGEYISCCEQAERAGTISYELLCALSRRVPRVYTD